MTLDIMTALRETEILWLELAKTGATRKCEAVVSAGIPHVNDYYAGCPCCQYDEDQLMEADRPHDIKVCSFCPIWSRESRCPEYRVWDESNDVEDRKAAALSIAVLARENLEFLESLGY